MKFADWLHALTEDTTPSAANDEMVTYDASAGASKRVKLSNLAASLTAGIPVSGWIAAGETWTYVSVDNPTGVIDATGDVRSTYQAGQRIVMTNGGNTIYGIITNVNGTLQSGNTRITFLHEINTASPTAALYLMANSAITNPKYSPVKAPLGFPLNPLSWTVRLADNTFRTQASPTIDVWYNLGSLSLTIPIGLWRTRYQAIIGGAKNNTINQEVFSTLSTANNSETDLEMSAHAYIAAGVSASAGYVETTVHRAKILSLAAKTVYYLNAKTHQATIGGLYIGSFASNTGTTIIEAECAYL